MFPPYDYTNTIEGVRKKFLKVFSEEFTDKTLNRAVADKELIEYKGDVYVACKKRKGEASYNSSVDSVLDEGNGKFTVVIAVKMPPSGNTLYVDLPTEKNAAGEFVFSDYPYWEKSEWSFLFRIKKHAEIFSRQKGKLPNHLIRNDFSDIDFSDSGGLLEFGNK